MSDALKYIIIHENNTKLAIVFNPILEHKTVAGNMNVLSAGFCHLHTDDNKATTWGKSISLGITSKPGDETFLHFMNPFSYF